MSLDIGQNLSDDQRNDIIRLHNGFDGPRHNNSQISRLLKITRKTVGLVIEKYKKYGSVKTRPGSGRPQKWSKSDFLTLANHVGMFTTDK